MVVVLVLVLLLLMMMRWRMTSDVVVDVADASHLIDTLKSNATRWMREKKKTRANEIGKGKEVQKKVKTK